jgi:MSHA biogenesis protein MshJ
MNSLLERLQKYIARVDELTLRERAIVLAAMLTLLFLGWYAYLIEPLKLTEKTLVAELDKKRTQLQTLNDQFTLMADKQKQDPNALARERLQQLREEQKQMTEELRGATANLVAPELMPEVLRSMLKSADGLSLISMRGLGSTPLLQPVADAKTAKPDGKAAPAPTEETPKSPDALNAAYRHGMQMEFSGDFFATLEFMRKLEALEWKFFWDNVNFVVTEYPQGVARISVFTLSLDRHWIGT